MALRQMVKATGKKYATVVCTRCGTEVDCSPHMAKRCVEDFAYVCARYECEGAFKLKDQGVATDGPPANNPAT